MNSSSSGVKTFPNPVRHVSKELIDSLDPLERFFAEKYIREGRWILDDTRRAENREG